MDHCAKNPNLEAVRIVRVRPPAMRGTRRIRELRARHLRRVALPLEPVLSLRPSISFPGVPLKPQSKSTKKKNQLHTIAMETIALGLIARLLKRRPTTAIVSKPRRARSATNATNLVARRRTDLIGIVKRIATAKTNSAAPI